MTDPNEPWFSQDEMDSRYGVNDPFREIEGYGLPCVLCGDEGHHVPGHERTPPTEMDCGRDTPQGRCALDAGHAGVCVGWNAQPTDPRTSHTNGTMRT